MKARKTRMAPFLIGLTALGGLLLVITSAQGQASQPPPPTSPPSGSLSHPNGTEEQTPAQPARADLSNGLSQAIFERSAEPLALKPVLLIMDVYPWGSTAIQDLLTHHSIPYDQVGSSAIPTVSLSAYGVVIIPSDQPQIFYDTYHTYYTKFDNYVANGGIVEFHAAAWGFQGGDLSGIPLPGGVGVEHNYQNYNYIELPGHPLVASLSNPLWGTSISHGHFADTLTDTLVICTEGSGPGGPPTLIEYHYGDGIVVASGQTLEYGYENAQDAGVILENMIPYVYSLVGEQYVLLVPSQMGGGPPGTLVSYTLNVINYTGVSDTFNLNVISHTWPISLLQGLDPITHTGPLDHLGIFTFTSQVKVPVTATPGMSDTAFLQATSAASPTVYSATAVLDTMAFCTPTLIFQGRSEQTYADLDDLYGGGKLFYAYVQVHSADNDTLDATISGHDPLSGAWQVIAQQSGGHSGTLVDRLFAPPVYDRVRLQLDDTENDDLIFYDYQLIFCREPMVQFNPLSQSNLVRPGTTAIYTQTLTNYMLMTDNFALTVSGNVWTTTFWYGGTPIADTGPLADLETFTFTVRVDAPPQATPGISDLATIRATSFASATISDTATFQTTAVEDLVYITLSDADQLALMDSASRAVVGSLNLGNYGCDFPWRAKMSPDRAHVYVACRWSSNVVVIETQNNTVVTTVAVPAYAGDIAFVSDGAYALVGGDWQNEIAVIDTATYSVTSILTPEDATGVAAHPYLDRAYATCENGTILVIDTHSFSIVETVHVGGEPWDVIVSPDGQWVFSGDRWGQGLTIIDAGSNRVHAILTGLGDLTGLDVAPDGAYLYAGGRSAGLHVIDGSTFEHVTTVSDVGSVWEVAVACDGSLIYVGNDGSSLPVIEAGTHLVIAHVAMPGGGVQGIATCPQARKSGLFLYPSAQQGFAPPGEAAVYQEILVNATGQTDSFDLLLLGNTWQASLSLANTGPVEHGGWISFTAQVTVPLGALVGETDGATIQATSVASPAVYSASAALTTTALCSPNLVFSGQSDHTTGDLDDVYSGGTLIYAYVYLHTSDDDNLDAAISGYDPGSGTWQTLTQQVDGGTGLLIDQLFIPPLYTQVRVQLDDTENDGDIVYYDYQFVLCREPTVDLDPPYQRGFARPGTTAVYTLTLTNYMMMTDSFDLEASGNVWTTTLWHAGTPITRTAPLADLEVLTLTARVDVPPGAAPGDTDIATIRATSLTSPTISDQAVLETATLDDLAYVTLSDDDLVALIDTSGQTVIGTVDVGAAGCDFPWRATMSPDRAYVYVGCRLSENIVVIATDNNTVVATVAEIPYPSDVAFVQNGAYALVGSYQWGQIAIVDTAAYVVTAVLPTPGDIRGIAAHPYLDQAYAGCDDGTILVVDTQAFTFTHAIPFDGEPWDLAVSPDGRWIFASDYRGSGLTVIDAGSHAIRTTVTGLGNLSGLDVAPDGAFVYAANRSNGLHVIDGNTFELLTTVPDVGGLRQVAVNCDGSLIYLGNDTDAVPVVDTGTFSVIEQIDMPGSGVRGIAICPPARLPGLFLYPAAQWGYGYPGENVFYEQYLVNAIGQTDSFDLLALGNAWDTTLSLVNTGPLEDGSWLTFTAQVTVPLDALPGDVDGVAVQATSTTWPDVYSATAAITTTALCSPALILSGQSAHTEGDLDDVYLGGRLIYAYVYVHTADDDSLNAAVSGYDPASGDWQIIAEQTNGGSGLLIDQFFIPPHYTQVRVQLNDTEDDDLIFYDYAFTLCREPMVILEPPFQQGSARLGETAVYTLTVTNYTMGTDVFELSVSGNAWPTTFWDGSTPIVDTGPLADLETFAFTARVEVPTGAPPGVWDTATVRASSQSTPAISDTAMLQTLSVGDLAYVTLAQDDLVALVETGGQAVVGTVDVGAAGCDSPWRATMSPDRDYVYVGCFDSSSLAVIETVNHTVVAMVIGTPNADDIAFVRNGAYALVGNRWSWSHHIAVVDTHIYSITQYISTDAEAHSVAPHPFLDRAYATSADGHILIIDTNTFTITGSIPVGGQPWDVTVSPDGRWVFASDYGGQGLAVIDVGSNTVYTTVTGLGDLAGLAAFGTPDGPVIYAAGILSGVHVLNGQTLTRVTTISGTGSAWQVAATCNGDIAYVGNRGGQVPVIDTAALTVTEQISMPGWGVRGIAVCPENVLALHVGKTDHPDPVAPGAGLTYTILVENVGNVDMNGVVVTDTLPQHTAFAWADGGGGLAGDHVRWVSQTVPAGHSLALRFGVTVTAGLTHGTLINNGDYGLSTPEGLHVFGEPVLTLVENPPILRISKTDAPDPVEAGGPLTYTLRLDNLGQPGADATGVAVTDSLPADTAFAWASAGGGLVGAQVRWTGQMVPAGGALTLTFGVTVSSALTDGAVLVNDAYGATCAQGASASGDPVSTTVRGAPILSLSKVDTPDPVLAGGLLTYTLTVRNLGSAAASGVTVTDTVPENTSFAWAGEGGSLVGDQVQWAGLALPAGARLTVTFGVTVGEVPSGSLITNADYGARSVEGEGAVGSPINTTVYVSGTVTPLPDLSIAKEVVPSRVQPGEQLNYTLRVHNTGDDDATGVVITDVLPMNTTFVWADMGGELLGDRLRWRDLAVPAGTDLAVHFIVAVRQVPSGTLIVNADYAASSVEGVGAVGRPVTASVYVSGTIAPLPALSISKVDSPDPVEAGGLLTYTLVVINAGQGDATGVTISDTLPDDTTFVWADKGGSLIENRVIWTGQTVSAGGGLLVSFAVAVADSLPNGSLISNTNYGVCCTQVPTPVLGSTVSTQVVRVWQVYLPVVIKAAP